MTTVELFVDCRNALGEGALWHPARRELFWFDLEAGVLQCADAAGTMLSRTEFGEPASAAAILDEAHLLVATASGLWRHAIDDGTRQRLAPLEIDDAGTRSNDGRADRHGGFWIGTMGRRAEPGRGALYRYARGRLLRLQTGLTIPNALCFAPDGRWAYLADTSERKIRRAPQDPATGLPCGPWQDVVDTRADGRGLPDGAVVDAEGGLWSARWGGGCVVRHQPDGRVDRIIELPVANVTCPALGGDDGRTLFLTTARVGLDAEALARQPQAGSVFAVRVDVPGLPEPAVPA